MAISYPGALMDIVSTLLNFTAYELWLPSGTFSCKPVDVRRETCTASLYTCWLDSELCVQLSRKAQKEDGRHKNRESTYSKGEKWIKVRATCPFNCIVQVSAAVCSADEVWVKVQKRKFYVHIVFNFKKMFKYSKLKYFHTSKVQWRILIRHMCRREEIQLRWKHHQCLNCIQF